MKTCLNCKGLVKKVIGQISISGITVDDIPYEQCIQCQEQYFDLKTSVFIQKISNYVKEERKQLLLEKLT
jgi:hypothetical protein